MKNVDTVKVEGTSFVRQISSMGLSNLDTSARDEYYARVRMAKNQKEEINKMKTEMSAIKDDISEMKQLLRQLIGKGTNG